MSKYCVIERHNVVWLFDSKRRSLSINEFKTYDAAKNCFDRVVKIVEEVFDDLKKTIDKEDRKLYVKYDKVYKTAKVIDISIVKTSV